MSMSLTDPLSDYVHKIVESNPKEAVQIALAQADLEKAKAAQAQAEYRALAEVEFDSKGRVVKANLAGLYRLASAYAKSKIVPAHYQSKPNQDATADCFIACQMAVRLGIDPLAYMQASYIVHGRPGIESKLATALLNTSGKIKGRLRYKFEGKAGSDDRSCTCFAIDAESGDEVSSTITWAMAKAEGWVDKSGSKWKTMPDVMFQYRSAMFLIRLYYSEVLMGVNTVDELEDIEPATPTGATRTLADMTARLGAPEPDNHVEDETSGGEVQGEQLGEEIHEDGEGLQPASEKYASWAEKFSTCPNITDCTDMKGRLRPEATTDEDRAELERLWTARCDAIRANRGDKAGKQGTLVQ